MYAIVFPMFNAYSNPTTKGAYAAFWERLFQILKHKHYRETVSLHIMLNRHCYHLNLPMIIIRGEERIFPATADRILVMNEKIVFKDSYFILTNQYPNTNIF